MSSDLSCHKRNGLGYGGHQNQQCCFFLIKIFFRGHLSRRQWTISPWKKLSNISELYLIMLRAFYFTYWVTFSHKYCVFNEIFGFKALLKAWVCDIIWAVLFLFLVHLRRTTSACYCLGCCYSSCLREPGGLRPGREQPRIQLYSPGSRYTRSPTLVKNDAFTKKKRKYIFDFKMYSNNMVPSCLSCRDQSNLISVGIERSASKFDLSSR